MTDEELFKNITDNMFNLYKAKNTDYGSSVHKTYQEFGLTSFLVRLSDKLNRAITLNRQDAMVKDEKIEDTLMDLANYSILALIEMKKQKEYVNKLTENIKWEDIKYGEEENY